MEVFLFESKMKDKLVGCTRESILGVCVSHASVGAAVVHAAPHLYSSEYSLESSRQWHACQTAVCFCSAEAHPQQLQVVKETELRNITEQMRLRVRKVHCDSL